MKLYSKLRKNIIFEVCVHAPNDLNLPYEMHPALWSVTNYSMGMLFHRGDPNDSINQRNQIDQRN